MLKKEIFFVSCLSLASISLFSQGFRKFRIDFGIGSPVGFSDPAFKINSLPIISLEPAYRIKDNWAVGFRLEGGYIRNNINSGSMILPNRLLTGSYGLYGQYYFARRNKLLFFSGLGVSSYTLGSNALIGDYSIEFEKNKIGLNARLGAEVGHFTMRIEYNFMSSVKEVFYYFDPGQPVQPMISYVSGNYFAIKASLFMGGGRKKKK